MARRDRGLRSELDTPTEGSTVERPPEPVGPPPGHHSGSGRWQLAWTWVPDQPEDSRPSVRPPSVRTGPVFTEEVRSVPPPRGRASSASRTPRAPAEEPPWAASSSSSRPRLTQPVPRRLAPSPRAERSEAPAPEEEAVEKPLILVDFHKTVSFEELAFPRV